MSAGSDRGRHYNKRKQNEEAEPFLVQQIPRSPVIRGRRQNSQEDSFQVEDMPGSPKMRGRVPRLIPSARNSVEQPAAGNTSLTDRGLNLTSDTIDSPIRMLPTAPSVSSSGNYITSPTDARKLDNDDAPPTYESSIPPVQVGWSSEVTNNIPFPMPYFNHNQDDERPANVFTYPPTDSYPSIGLSPFAKSYQSVESSRSKSPLQSTSPSLSPSPNRFRPAYTYQPRFVERTPSPRPRLPVDDNDARYVAKIVNLSVCPFKYAAIVMLIFFIFFLVMLGLAFRFFIKHRFN